MPLRCAAALFASKPSTFVGSEYLTRLRSRRRTKPRSPTRFACVTCWLRRRPPSTYTAYQNKREICSMDQEAFEQAVRSYWTVRESQAAKQLASSKVDAGSRGSVTGGTHLDALAQVFADLFVS